MYLYTTSVKDMNGYKGRNIIEVLDKIIPIVKRSLNWIHDLSLKVLPLEWTKSICVICVTKFKPLLILTGQFKAMSTFTELTEFQFLCMTLLNLRKHKPVYIYTV